ncbi:MAG: hypothetical protein P1U58_18025 [Verrucomicrobiales bacterium]|nr:hypothetical protein [Verrucomicrobiales bacterium]
MRLLAQASSFLLAVLSCEAFGQDGLYIPNREAEPAYSIEDGDITMRIPSERLVLTQAVFRYDTEDKSKFWLELDFTKMADPGDFYIFLIDGAELRGFTVRGEGSNDGGGRWALGFTDPEKGRKLLSKIATIYDLSGEQVLDKTAGEQGDDAN